MDTLLLDINTWDLVIDADNNIAVASDPYSQAQDAASMIKLFQGELYYDTTKGVPYWTSVLGFDPPIQLLKTYFNQAASVVPGVTASRTFITGLAGRLLSGQVQITNTTNQTAIAAF